MKIKKEKTQMKLNGRKIDLCFFQEQKNLPGITIKEMEKIIE